MTAVPRTTRWRAPGPRVPALLLLAGLGVTAVAAGCTGDDTPAAPTTTCPAGQIACGLHCLDATADPMNCGGCGIPCGTGQLCQGGACQCVSGVLCNGSCVSPEASQCGTAPESGTSPGSPPTIVTSARGAYWKTDGTVADVTGATTRADLTVSDGSTAQIWEGFGGAFNELGWHYLSMLSEGDRARALHLLYGADGARFTFGRIPIGASDYAIERYTLDETADDLSLAGFSIERDLQNLIPYIKAAQATKENIRFWASPWTPPTWMKQGPFQPGNVVSPFDGGTIKNDAATLGLFARYLVKFVQAYAQQGIDIEAISPQNEPNYTGNYPTCGWMPPVYTTFVGQYLGPAIADAGLATKVILGTFNGGGSDPEIVASVMGDRTARDYVGALGYQWGMLGRVARAARSYQVPVWQTEHKAGNYPWVMPFAATMAPNDEAYAVESWGLIRDWIKAGVTAYSAWNMVLDTAGIGIDTTRVWPQGALLTVDVSAKQLNVTPTYYVFRHLSQFVVPGARVVATSAADSVAFRNPDGSLVLVVYNAGSAKTLTVAIAGKRLQVELPGHGWATVLAH